MLLTYNDYEDNLGNDESYGPHSKDNPHNDDSYQPGENLGIFTGAICRHTVSELDMKQ